MYCCKCTVRSFSSDPSVGAASSMGAIIFLQPYTRYRLQFTGWFERKSPNCVSHERMPLATSTRTSHVRYHADRHEQRKRVT